VEVGGEGRDREALVVDEGLAVFLEVVGDDFVGCYLSKGVHVDNADFVSRH
jgi:hypothetical protein